MCTKTTHNHINLEFYTCQELLKNDLENEVKIRQKQNVYVPDRGYVRLESKRKASHCKVSKNF